MSIIRLIHIKIDPSEAETAERIWKTECATLMISQKGCISEKLLRARERGEFISYSEWETETDIERYTNSAAHKQIVSHTRSVKGAIATQCRDLCRFSDIGMTEPSAYCGDRR